MFARPDNFQPHGADNGVLKSKTQDNSAGLELTSSGARTTQPRRAKGNSKRNEAKRNQQR